MEGMIQLRKTFVRDRSSIYKHNAVIRIAKGTQAMFIVSEIIIKKLKINIDTDGIMFGIKNKVLCIYKEPKESDNYHLAKADASTYRFRSIELYNYVSDFFKVEKNKAFYIEMQNDNTFKLLK